MLLLPKCAYKISFQLQGDTLSEVYFMFIRLLLTFRVDLGRHTDILQVLATISEHKTRVTKTVLKPVQLLETLWQYHVHRGPK